MKMIVAFVRPHMLPKVTLALHDIDSLSGVSISDVRGFGRGRAAGARDHIKEGGLSYLPRVRIEVVCSDAVIENTVAIIERSAHTGLRGDGKIFVIDVEHAVRISTGERDDEAV